MADKQTSGLEKIPQILKKPFYSDRLFWIGIAMAIAWILFFRWLFG